MGWLKLHWLETVVHAAALALIAWVAWDYTQGNLGANPIEQVQIRTGKYTLNILVLTLACTPVYNISGYQPVVRLRRVLGFYALGFASLHLMAFVGLDYHFDFPLLWADVGSKLFVLIGLAAFLILVLLAVTSSAGWKKRLGKNWKRLQRLVYLVGLLAALHFIWQTKLDFRTPFIYSAVIILLLVLRIPWVVGVVGKNKTGEP